MSGFDLPDGTSEIFFALGLDDPNHVESPHENLVYAHAISHAKSLSGAATSTKLARFACRRANQAHAFASSSHTADLAQESPSRLIPGLLIRGLGPAARWKPFWEAATLVRPAAGRPDGSAQAD
jgi:hypothetical protein